MSLLDNVTLKYPKLVELLRKLWPYIGRDIDGDIMPIQGHIFFVYALRDIVNEVAADNNNPLGSRIWKWTRDPDKDKLDNEAGFQFADTIYIFAETEDEARMLIYNKLQKSNDYIRTLLSKHQDELRYAIGISRDSFDPNIEIPDTADKPLNISDCKIEDIYIQELVDISKETNLDLNYHTLMRFFPTL